MSRRTSKTTHKRVSGTYRVPRLKDTECRRLENHIKLIEETIDMLQGLVSKFFKEAESFFDQNLFEHVKSILTSIDLLNASIVQLYEDFFETERKIEERVKLRRFEILSN